MPPATAPIPVLILDELETALALPDGGSDYYHDVKMVAFGEDITAEQVSGYPAIFIGEPGEVGQVTETQPSGRVLWHGTWYWDIPVFGVISDVGGGKEAYRNLLRLVADIYRAVNVSPGRGGNAVTTDVLGWTMLGPQDATEQRPWVAVLLRVLFRTKDTHMVTQ